MILRDNEIQGRFKDLLSAHARVDIATAWATCGEHLRMLADATKRERMPVEVRAIVGTAGNTTRPDALGALYRITKGSLRIIWNENQPRLFHPKLYLFGQHTNGRAQSHAWVGSANFTNAGFGCHAKANEELLVEMGPGKTTDALAACRSIGRYPISSMISSRGIVKTFSLSSKRPSFSALVNVVSIAAAVVNSTR